MDQKHGKVHDIEVGNGNGPALGASLDDLAPVGKDIGALRTVNQATCRHDLVSGQTGGQAVGPRLDPVSQVVDVTGDTPPARGEQLATSLGLDVLEVRNLGVVGVGAERILLEVGGAEDVKAQADEREHARQSGRSQRQRVDGQVASLLRVHERHPDEVTERKHHAETVRGNVHCRQNGGLKPPRVDNVQSLHNGDADDAVGNVAVVAVLLGAPRAVEDNPPHHAGAELAPLLEIDFADKGDDDAGVELAADEPVIEKVSRMTTGGQLAVLLVAGLDAEAANVDKGRNAVRNHDAGGKKLQVVFADEDPDRKVGALRSSASSEKRQGQGVRVESYSQLSAKIQRYTRRRIYNVLLKRYLRRPPDARTVPSVSMAGRTRYRIMLKR